MSTMKSGLTTPEKIRTLQRKLYHKAKQEPGFRFYALYDKVYRTDILSHAYDLVRANRGSAGIDGRTFKGIEEQEGKAAFLATLEEELKRQTYKPDPVKRVMIPKTDGGERPLGIPTIRDRVTQMTVKLVIEPIFEADFCDNSYGFRPKKSAHGAIDNITYAMNTGHTEVIDADISKYFDTIPHARLMATVAERICDKSILHIIRMWLKAPVVEEGKDGKKRYIGGGKGNRKGTPQGGVISPLLANLYLHLMDRIWERHQIERRYGAHIIRYADDFVVMCKRGTKESRALIERILERLGLSLNETKTSEVNALKDSFNFLGFEIRMRKGMNSGKTYPHVQPSRKSLKKIRSEITRLTRRQMTPVPMGDIVARVNMVLRGWTGYFHYRNCSKSLSQLKWHVEERMQRHLCARHKVRSLATGYKRFPTGELYGKYGLYKVPTTAGWTKAHALR